MSIIYYGYFPDSESDAPMYGTPRHSGRYPWGSGKNPQRNRNFLSRASDLKKQGLTDKQIAEAFGMSTGQYRAMHTIAVNEQKKDTIRRVQTLYDAGNSKSAIARELNIPESTVRNYLNPSFQARRDKASLLADRLKEQVEERKYLDVGEGVNLQLNVSKEQMKAAIELLKQAGYTYHRISVPQASDPTQKTNVVVLTKDDVSFSEVMKNRDKISSPDGLRFEDYGTVIKTFTAPKSIDSKRIDIRWPEEGGADKDGVIEIREGVADLDIGGSRYAQVRIAVDGTHYLKGMAMYADPATMPPGVDIIFNTSKDHATFSKINYADKDHSVLKPMKTKDENGKKVIDTENPFGASIKDQRGALNIVNEDEDWEKWSKNLASQFLSKQPYPLAKKQLDITYKEKKQEFDEICSLTNPTIKRKLLESFADDCDSAVVHLKAAALPRQAAHVILPINSLKDNEIYAPNYENGEEVVLIRYPHAGPFEMPRLRVNNNNEEARKLLGVNAKTAVGINSNVAKQLSGADFDGDTVTVIPTKGVNIKTSKCLAELENFDHMTRYSAYEGMPRVGPDTGFHKQMQMGKISNLITDMTIHNATDQEIARAVKHSMVIIDAEKHNLDWRASEKDNGIKELYKKYQGKANGGASTLISKAKSPEYVLDRTEIHSLKSMTPEEQEAYLAGNKIFRNTGKMKQQKDGSYVPKTIKSNKMTEAFVNGGDAFDLSSGTVIEDIYANHANKLKALANEARKEQLRTGRLKQNASAKEAYKPERDSLISKLNIAKKNSPLERQAQLIASVKSSARINANPNLDKDDKKKIRAQEIARARQAVGTKSRNPNNPNSIGIRISDREWAAIQSGAISDNILSEILRYSNIDELKQRATPRTNKGLSVTAKNRARTLINRGYTQAEVAETLGISVSTLNKVLNE